jgi:hypothetical protein
MFFPHWPGPMRSSFGHSWCVVHRQGQRWHWPPLSFDTEWVLIICNREDYDLPVDLGLPHLQTNPLTCGCPGCFQRHHGRRSGCLLPILVPGWMGGALPITGAKEEPLLLLKIIYRWVCLKTGHPKNLMIDHYSRR